MPDKEKDLTFHSRYKRPAHGCLPLFVIGAFLLVFALMWWVPVQSPGTPRPLGVGRVTYLNNAQTRSELRQICPLSLLQPWAHDPDFAEEEGLPLRRELRAEEAPPPEPPVRDSAVLRAEELLALPPEPGSAAAQQQEVQP
ncbi:MAG: hypothetical protein ACI4O9_05465 [Akkermansia sp.]